MYTHYTYAHYILININFVKVTLPSHFGYSSHKLDKFMYWSKYSISSYTKLYLLCTDNTIFSMKYLNVDNKFIKLVHQPWTIRFSSFFFFGRTCSFVLRGEISFKPSQATKARKQTDKKRTRKGGELRRAYLAASFAAGWGWLLRWAGRLHVRQSSDRRLLRGCASNFSPRSTLVVLQLI